MPLRWRGVQSVKSKFSFNMLQRDLSVSLLENCKQPQSLHLLVACTLVADTILSVYYQTGLAVGECFILHGCELKQLRKQLG